MANSTAVDIASRVTHGNGAYGDAAIHQASLKPASAAINEIFTVVRIPAGTRVDRLCIENDEIDSGTDALRVKVGYTPVNAAEGPAAVTDYWGSALTTLNAAGVAWLKGKPIVFEFAVDLIITVTTAANAFAGAGISEVTMIALCTNVGTK